MPIWKTFRKADKKRVVVRRVVVVVLYEKGRFDEISPVFAHRFKAKEGFSRKHFENVDDHILGKVGIVASSLHLAKTRVS